MKLSFVRRSSLVLATLGLTQLLLTLPVRAATTAGAAALAPAAGEAASWGWLSLLPPALAILLALIFRDVLVALFLGIFSGALMLAGWNPFAAFGATLHEFVVPALADADHAAIIIFTTMLGGMVGLITKSGGTHGIVERLTPFATSRRRGMVATWAMGVAVFFDDYANTLIVGPTMRPITDRLRISREKLAYIVDSTAAPVVCLFPISTWVGFEFGLISDAFASLELPVQGYDLILRSIPYRFYPIFALVLVLTLALRRVDFGPMAAAEKRARETGQVLAPDARPIADYSSEEVEPPADAPKRAFNAVIPIATVIIVTLIGLYLTGRQGSIAAGIDLPSLNTGERFRELLSNANSYHALLWASLAGMVMALILPVAQRILPLTKALAAMLAGMKAMFMALLVLTLAWSLSAVCDQLHTADFLVGLTQGAMPVTLLPAVTFLLAAVIAFATGSSWGTMGILEPLVIPIAHSLLTAAGHEFTSDPYQAVMLGAIASVLAGSVWGDHCSPISDTTILSSMASGCDHVAHVRTQLPYALPTGLLAILFGSLPSAQGVSPWLLIVAGIGTIVAVVWFAGRNRVEPDVPVPR